MGPLLPLLCHILFKVTPDVSWSRAKNLHKCSHTQDAENCGGKHAIGFGSPPQIALQRTWLRAAQSCGEVCQTIYYRASACFCKARLMKGLPNLSLGQLLALIAGNCYSQPVAICGTIHIQNSQLCRASE